MFVKDIDEVFAEAEKAFLKLELLEEEPKIGEYFGIITNVECLTPYYSDKSSYIYEGNIFDNVQAYPLLFKRIGEETIIEVSTGIPFLLNPYYYKTVSEDALEKNKFFQEKFLKYKKVGLFINDSNYLDVNDDFKLFYSKMMNQNLKEKLKDYAKIAHEQFDNAFTGIVNRTQAIASVDNAMYDMEQKHKVKTLTKPNDDQK